MAVRRAAPAKKATAKPVVKDRLDQRALAREYGYVNDLINSNPELRSLFAQAYGKAGGGQWTPTMFQARLQNTKWFKTHSDQWRKTEALRFADPETFKASVTQATANVKALAAKLGATITPAQAASLGRVFYQGNYDQTQQQGALAAYIGAAGGKAPAGIYGDTLQSLKTYADQMGVVKDSTWLASAAKSVASGLSTPDQWTSDIMGHAKSLYTPFASRIDAGMTVKDLASSYTNQMEQTLELPNGSVGLMDPTVQEALKGTSDPKTGIPATQNLWDFDQKLRTDGRWQQTKAANQLANDTAMNVFQSFGLVG